MPAYLDSKLCIDGIWIIPMATAELKELCARCYYSYFPAGGEIEPKRVWPLKNDPLDYSLEFEWQDIDFYWD
jgi:hypothetical protein